MDKPRGLYIHLDNKDYDKFKEAHKGELLRSAVAAIDPDGMGMDRAQAMILAGAMKNCGFTQADFAEVAARSRFDKGTFAKQWGKIRGSGKNGECTEATIWSYAMQSGWSWPAPSEFEGKPASPQKATTKPQETAIVHSKEIRLSCIMDSECYASKPSNVWQIRNREQVPTPPPQSFTMQEFARAVTSGRTFYPTVYNKVLNEERTRKEGKNQYDYRAISQQIFVVDIDNDQEAHDKDGKPIKDEKTGKRKKERIDNPLTIDGALEICKQNDIAPFFVYETFSSKAHREDLLAPYVKFRLCFATDEPLTVQEVGEHGIDAAINYFIGLFGNAADTNVTDYARLIYGTDEKKSARLFGTVISKNKLIKRLYEPPAEPEGQAAEDPIEIKSGAELIDEFISTIQTREFEPIETGISDIDRALKGGFVRRTMVMLGAAPGLGKTTLMQWILENMAKSGHDVLYINLEMDRAQLLARSMSRLAWKYDSANIDALKILQGYHWDKESRAAILRTADRYKREIAPRFIYNPDGLTNKISDILKVMCAVTDKIKSEGRPAPLVCIDYLQLIDTEDRDATEGLKDAIAGLKTFAKDNGTIIFVITANNRESNKTGVTNLESGRDTSAIEYTGDYMLGLSYTVIEDGYYYQYGWTKKEHKPALRKCDLDYIRRLRRQAADDGKETPAVCNEVSLKINKNRFGEPERRVKLILDGEHSTFNLTEYGRKLPKIPPLFDFEEDYEDVKQITIGGKTLESMMTDKDGFMEVGEDADLDW